MRTIDSYSFAGKRALIRVDFNVPLNKAFEVTDDTRIVATLPTLKKILSDGGSCVLMSHLGRPKEGPEEKYSLKHLIPELEKHFGKVVHFAGDCISDDGLAQAKALQPGHLLLLENLRFYKQEEKGDVDFAQKLSRLGDVWVNDAFGTAHRAHASTAVIGQFFTEKVCGKVMQAEIDNARKVLDDIQRPYTAIMGGAKISDKILIIERLMDKVDNLLIGGAMAYTFFKAMGGQVGKSLVEEDRLDLAKELIAKAKSKGVNLLLPGDSICGDKFAADAQTLTASNQSIPSEYMGLDIGPEAIKAFKPVIEQAKTVLWNGPMGVFEMEAFATGTRSVAESVVAATSKGAFSLIGGGDSAAAVNQFGFGDQVSYVSTGGGALLEYMEGKVLPGVAALD